MVYGMVGFTFVLKKSQMTVVSFDELFAVFVEIRFMLMIEQNDASFQRIAQLWIVENFEESIAK